MPKLTIAIDGPAGSGKSSLAKRVAQILGYLYLDSGAMYRALALKALRSGIAMDNFLSLDELARATHIELIPPTSEQEAAGSKNCVFLDGEDVTQAIRTAEVAQSASRLATIAGVREILVAEQQRAGAGGGVVMEGRDIGTVVFPRAELKVFWRLRRKCAPSGAGRNIRKRETDLRFLRCWKKFASAIDATANEGFAVGARVRRGVGGQHSDGC